VIVLAFLAGVIVGALGLWWAVLYDDIDHTTRVVADPWWLGNADRWEGLRRIVLEERGLADSSGASYEDRPEVGVGPVAPGVKAKRR